MERALKGRSKRRGPADFAHLLMMRTGAATVPRPLWQPVDGGILLV
jgi:hypothetical protein